MTGLTRKEREVLAAAVLERDLRRARGDPNDFCEYVFRDDKKHPIRQTWFQREWQNFLSRNQMGVLFAPIEHGKSTQIAIMRAVYEMGCNPGARGVVVSDTLDQASKFLTAIKANIESNERLHLVFDHLRRENFRTWKENALLLETSEPTTEKDFTVQAVGTGGAIMGARLNWIILDDLLDLDNTWTEDRRQKTIEWYQTTILSRALEGCKVWMIGTPWHPGDLMHYLADTGEYAVRRYDSMIPRREYNDKTGAHLDGDPDELVPIWPEQWPMERLKKREAQMSPFRFRQQFRCLATDEATTPFRDSAFKKAKLKGKGMPYDPDGWDGPVWTGVDLARGTARKHAMTTFITVGLTEDADRYLLQVVAGRYHAGQIESIIRAIFDRYGSIFYVENNAMQQLMIDFLQRDTTIPVVPYTTGAQKSHPEFGVESIAVEMENGRWIFPNEGGVVHPEVQALINEMAAYNPRSHTGDRLMGLYFAREGLRRHERRGRGVNVRVIGGRDDGDRKPTAKRRRRKPLSEYFIER